MATTIRLLTNATPEFHRSRSIATQPSGFRHFAVQPTIYNIRSGDRRQWHLSIAEGARINPIRTLTRRLTVAVALEMFVEH